MPAALTGKASIEIIYAFVCWNVLNCKNRYYNIISQTWRIMFERGFDIMERNVEGLKTKIMEKLPELLPKVIKSVVVHIVMLIYHISMPPWVTAIKIKKSLNSYNVDGTKNENYRRMKKRRSRRNKHLRD